MSVRNYVPVDVDDLPETFEYDLDGDTYQLSFDYNDEGNFFTCSIADSDDTPIVTGEKLVLNRPLFGNIYDERLPDTQLVPMDESGQARDCGIDEFMVTVFLYEDTVDPDDIENGELPIDGDVEGGYDD